MARAQNPYAGTYRPSNPGLSKNEVVKGIQEAAKKLKFPNRHLTTTGYKSGLKKEPEKGAK